jgi:hypothetical protein
MNKSTVMRTFNTHFIEFIDDIINIFPEQMEIQTAKNGFESINYSNPSLIIRVWYLKIYCLYKEQIDGGNIDFFFEKDYSQDLQNMNKNTEIMSFIDSIRIPLKNMDAANKEHSVKYIQNLSKLSMMYNAM